MARPVAGNDGFGTPARDPSGGDQDVQTVNPRTGLARPDDAFSRTVALFSVHGRWAVKSWAAALARQPMPRNLTLSALALLAGLTIAAAALAEQSAPAPGAPPVAPEQPVPPAPPPPGVPAEQMPGSPPPPPPSPVVTPEQAQPAPVAPAEQVPPPSPPVVPAEQVASAELTGLLGEEVVGPGGTELGHIVDLLVDTQGRMRAVVVDVGGFMGVGSRKVAVAWSAVRFTSGPKGPVVSIVIPLDRIKSWAEYIAGRPVAILGAPGSTP